MLLMPKKDGTKRLVVDYRPLNSVTTVDAYPMPLVEEVLNCLQGASVFSALDMCSRYHQIKMDPNDSLKTAFAIRGGNYAF